ncbi:c-type cytochrome [Geomesophilobacter sediminis]|uniref:C-type cytochrome n=1 Tax=Geomesophilobacter sediminis TaxID=2798584 RepID=A0A8J7JDV3_9BACT|nr:c-type cytochrome [Geomesophilobacter sediminis]MBJ6723939.1 c-type cytochrome [Geomesophilobacter sediminis]
MKKAVTLGAVLLSISALSVNGYCDVKKGQKINGATEFQEHCASCHPKGGNIVNAKKPLNKKALNANGIRTAKDIVAKMRNPGPGMTKFDEKSVPTVEANAIAEYILKTFK